MLGIDLLALAVAAAALGAIWILKRAGVFNKSSGAITYSSIETLKTSLSNWKMGFSWISPFLYLCGLLLLLVAFLNPHQTVETKEKNPAPIEGRALFLLVDQSGSMGGPSGAFEVGGELVKQTKLDRLKQIMKPFIRSRNGDLLGLVAFARGATVLSPLSVNVDDLIDQLNGIEVITKDDENGTAIGYALYKTAHLISEFSAAAAYKIHEPVMIVLTDGLQDPNPNDFGNVYRTMGLEEAASFAKKEGIRVYMVNFEPRIMEEKFKPNLHEMQRAVQMTGGKLLIVKDADQVAEALDEINAIEKSQFTPPEDLKRTETVSYFAPFAFAALFCLLGSILLSETIFRRVP